MDRRKAIESFQRHGAIGASVTDEAVSAFFGAELAAAVTELERYDRERGICASCGGACCREVACALYRPEAPRCPIHGERPLLCRLHFCERFLATHRELVVGLRDVFLACLGEEAPCPPFPKEAV